MNTTLIFSLILLSSIASLAALIIYFISKTFCVYVNPLISEIEELLPSGNCGGCGFPGCANFTEELVKVKDLSELNCPVAGSDVMKQIADLLGITGGSGEKNIAVLKCKGDRDNAPDKFSYEGIKSCHYAGSFSAGNSGCEYGCLGFGDCVFVCHFGALKMNSKGLPEVDTALCTGCNACVTECPRLLFELRPVSHPIYVACMNQEKGAPAKKNCKVACIGCTKCIKVIKSEFIKVENFLCYISPKYKADDYQAVADSCPTKAIIVGGSCE